MATYVRICDYCGEEFLANRKDKRFCTSSHRALFSQNGTQQIVINADTKRKTQSATPAYSGQITELLVQNVSLMEQNNYLLGLLVDAMQRGFVFQGVAVPTPSPNFSVPNNLLTQGEGKKSEPPKVVFDESAARARTVANSLAAIEDF